MLIMNTARRVTIQCQTNQPSCNEGKPATHLCNIEYHKLAIRKYVDRPCRQVRFQILNGDSYIRSNIPR